MNKAEQIERAIEVLKDMLPAKVDYAEMVGAPIGYSGIKFVYEAEEPYLIELAIEALEQQLEREKNEPLTLEQLEDMVGEPVWVQCEIIGFEDTYGWCIVERIINGCLVEITIDGEYSKINYNQYIFYKYKKESD